MGNYLPFLRMAEGFKIPWFILSDGEPATVEAVNNALTVIGQSGIPNNDRVIVLPEGKDFEAYIVSGATKDLLISTIIEYKAKNPKHKIWT